MSPAATMPPARSCATSAGPGSAASGRPVRPSLSAFEPFVHGMMARVDATLSHDLERFAEVLEAHFHDALVSLVAFGSQVQGRARPESDLDVLIIIRDLPRRRLDRRRLITPLAHDVSDAFAATVSAVLLTPEEAASIKPFYLGLLDGHRILVDRGDLVRGTLGRLERRLAELGARRLTDELGNGYWDLKPDYVFGEDVVL
jgi:predicted nucleotidyltransferase